MKLCVIVAVTCLVAVALADSHDPTSREAFQAWASRYGRTEYLGANSDAVETNRRYSVWKANVIQAELDTAESLAANPNGAVYGDSPFMDITPEEFASIYLMPAMTGEERRASAPADFFTEFNPADNDAEIPDEFDWDHEGLVSPVHNQGACGSCWAFAATSVIESAYRIADGSTPNVATQQIVSCMPGSGCNGGLEWEAYRDIIDNDHKVQHSEDYPYKAKTGKCKEDLSKADLTLTTAWRPSDINSADEKTMQKMLVQKGPLSVGISANKLMSYSSGIISGSCSHSLDHSVVVTGYGEEGGVPFWRVKNSWGSTWGEDGYFRFEYGTNQCGICDDVSAATVDL